MIRASDWSRVSMPMAAAGQRHGGARRWPLSSLLGLGYACAYPPDHRSRGTWRRRAAAHTPAAPPSSDARHHGRVARRERRQHRRIRPSDRRQAMNEDQGSIRGVASRRCRVAEVAQASDLTSWRVSSHLLGRWAASTDIFMLPIEPPLQPKQYANQFPSRRRHDQIAPDFGAPSAFRD